MIATEALETKCKVCGCVVVARADKGCPQSWIDKLKPMLTCNRCYDLMDRKRKIEDRLYKAANSLRFGKIKPAAKLESIDIIKKALKDYAIWFAELNGQLEHHYSEDIAESIVEHPEKIWTVLKMYRKAIVELYKNIPATQSPLPYKD